MAINILWCGGEDIDFSAGTAPVVDTDAAKYRAIWARCALRGNAGQTSKGTPLPGGAVSTLWLAARLRYGSSFTSSFQAAQFGIIRSGTAKGIFVGNTSGANSKISLYKYDGTTATLLASQAGTSVVNSAQTRLDMQIANFGASATINVYLDEALIISFSGDASISGIADLDQVCSMTSASSLNDGFWWSEVVVADGDTRQIPGLLTLALTGAGSTDEWTGAYSDINSATFSDTTPNYVDIVDKIQQFNITDAPTGIADIVAIKVSARMARSSGSTPTSVALGFKNGASIVLGADIPVSTAYANYEQYLTSSMPTYANMNALQLEAKSRT